MTDRAPIPHNPKVHALLPSAYEELRRIAGNYLRNPGKHVTLQPTALLHEAFMKVQGFSGLDVQDRTHLIALTAVAMRQILLDHVRAKKRLKRGGGEQVRVSLSLIARDPGADPLDLIDLDRALVKLADEDPRLAQIVEMRFFGDLDDQEIASLMGRSDRWVRLQLAFAKTWLAREMRRGGWRS